MVQFPEIPHYRIEKKFGKGAMGTVYLAFQENLERYVALKVLLPSLSDEPEITKRFITEAKIGAQLQHSNIVSIFDVGEHEGIYYFSMEYLEMSLKDFIKSSQEGRLKPEIALDIVKQIAHALDYAHKKGVIHRDVKPANILLRNDGAPVLVDFGIAKLMESSSKITKTGTSVGTPHYMSPEQIQGQDIDGRADLYSLGVVFFEMLEGKPPYEGTDSVAIAVKHVREPIPRLKEELNLYQPIVDKMMAKDRRERIQTGNELVSLIQNLLLGSLAKEKESTVIRKSEKVSKAKEMTAGDSGKTDKKSPILKPLVYLVIFVVLIGLGMLGVSHLRKTSEIREKEFWKTTQQKNTSQSYTQYIKKYPNGRFVFQAQKILADFKKLESKPKETIETSQKNQRIIQYKILKEQAEMEFQQGEYKKAREIIRLAREIMDTEALAELEKKIMDRELSQSQYVKLRKNPREINIAEVQAMLKKFGFFDFHKNRAKNFKNRFSIKNYGPARVVEDRATGLFWHQAGSPHYMNLDMARNWIAAINRQHYAGFTDWRLPTAEEAASLLEIQKTATGMHIHPFFSEIPKSIWTSDSLGQEIWIIYFDHGYLDVNWPLFNSYVRPVRPLD